MPVPTRTPAPTGRRFLLRRVEWRIGGHGGEIAPDPFTIALTLDLLGGSQPVLHVGRHSLCIAITRAGPGDRLVREGSIELGKSVSLTFRKVLFGVNPSRLRSPENSIDSRNLPRPSSKIHRCTDDAPMPSRSMRHVDHGSVLLGRSIVGIEE